MRAQTILQLDHQRAVASEPSRRACLSAILRMAGMRATRQRLDLADCLISRDRHVTAEELFEETSSAGQEMSLATVYNTLRQFQSSGLVRELAFEGVRSVFDTDTSRHHHFHLAEEGQIVDIPGGCVQVSDLPNVPDGYEIERVEVVVRLRRREK